METLSKQKNKKNELLIYGICLLISVLFLMVCSSNSFIYAFNDWVDLNWYRTMGRGVVEGKIIYKDIFDHKGPLTYFVFAFIELFKNPLLVVYIIECLTFSIFLYLCYKFLSKKLNNFNAIIGTILVAFIIPSLIFFNSGGGAVEEYFIPAFMYFFNVFDDYIHGKNISKFQSIIFGIILALLFWSKFTLIVIPAIFIITWFVLKIRKKEIKDSFMKIGLMLLSFIISSLPIIIYFIVNNATMELIQMYFGMNLFAYNNSGWAETIMAMLGSKILYYLISFVFIAIFAFLSYISFKKSRDSFLLLLPFFIQLSLFLVIMKSPQLYYFLIFVPWIVWLTRVVISKIKSPKLIKYQILTSIIVFISLFGLSFITCNNTCDLGKKQSEYIQYQICNDIKSFNIPNQTLFCYNMLDYGFYNVLGVVPTERFYARNNFTKETFPEMFESFDNAIREGHSDFVIAFKEDYEKNKSLFETHYIFVNEYNTSFYYLDVFYENQQFVLLKKSSI